MKSFKHLPSAQLSDKEAYNLVLDAASSNHLENFRRTIETYPNHFSIEILHRLLCNSSTFFLAAIDCLQKLNQLTPEIFFKKRDYVREPNVASIFIFFAENHTSSILEKLFQLAPWLLEAILTLPSNALESHGVKTLEPIPLMFIFVALLPRDFCEMLIGLLGDRLWQEIEFEFAYQDIIIPKQKMNALHLALFLHKIETLDLLLDEHFQRLYYQHFIYNNDSILPLDFAIRRADKELIEVLAHHTSWNNSYIPRFFPKYAAEFCHYLDAMDWSASWLENGSDFSGNILHALFSEIGRTLLLPDSRLEESVIYLNFIEWCVEEDPELLTELDYPEEVTPFFKMTHCTSLTFFNSIVNILTGASVDAITPQGGPYAGWDYRQYQFKVNRNLAFLRELAASSPPLPRSFPVSEKEKTVPNAKRARTENTSNRNILFPPPAEKFKSDEMEPSNNKPSPRN
jgi:hypothetical protein